MNKLSIFVLLISSSTFWLESSAFLRTKSVNDLLTNNVYLPKPLEATSSPDSGQSSAVEPPLLVGSFNIQTLVRRKFNRPDVMDIIRKIILRYDLLLVLEIHTDEDHYMETLLNDVNEDLPPGEAYKMTLSERHNGTKEHYALLYKTNKLKVISSESYDDPSIFFRKPLVVILEAFTLRDMKKFGVIGQHVKPSKAVREINGLAEIYDYVRLTYGVEDVLLMGDFNADCVYVKEMDWDRIALWYRSEFTWAITTNMDTTTNYKSCALDRFVYAGENMNDGVILSSAKIFNFQEEYMLSTYETRNISDHWPIELKIRGKMSDLAEKHLTAKVCFKLQDSQPQTTNITRADIFSLAKKAFFNATKTVDGILLSNQTREEEDMLHAMKTLRFRLPNVITHELEEAVKYKVNHGSLRDDSSYADVYNSRYTIKIRHTNELIQASICRATTVN